MNHGENQELNILEENVKIQAVGKNQAYLGTNRRQGWLHHKEQEGRARGIKKTDGHSSKNRRKPLKAFPQGSYTACVCGHTENGFGGPKSSRRTGHSCSVLGMRQTRT